MLKRHKKSRHLGKLLEKLGGGRARDDSSPYIDGADLADDRRSARINEILTARRDKFLRARELLLDRDATAFVLVLTPEKLPILESKKARDLLEQHSVAIAAIVVNRILPENAEGEFLTTRRQQEEKYLQEIERAFHSIRRYDLPLLPHDVYGVDTLRHIGRLLAGDRNQ
jgi:arsenite-transporting ATPase